MITLDRVLARLLCPIGLHRYPHFVNAWSQAPARVRCERCGRQA